MAYWLASAMVGMGLVLPGQGGDGTTPREVTLRGTVVELADVLKARGVEADGPSVAGQVVLKGEDGAVTPLLSGVASRALFRDERLRDRPAEVLGWLRPGLPYLEVVTFRIEEQGMLRTPEYYCDLCKISVRFPQDCPCCQGELELRYKPAPDFPSGSDAS